MTIGDIIRNRRKELNMTQEDVAKAVNTTKATVSRWESGDISKIKNKTMEKLAHVLNMDPMLFLQREEVLMPEEVDVINAYRKADDGTRSAVRKLLDVEEKTPAQSVG